MDDTHQSLKHILQCTKNQLQEFRLMAPWNWHVRLYSIMTPMTAFVNVQKLCIDHLWSSNNPTLFHQVTTLIYYVDHSIHSHTDLVANPYFDWNGLQSIQWHLRDGKCTNINAIVPIKLFPCFMSQITLDCISMSTLIQFLNCSIVVQTAEIGLCIDNDYMYNYIQQTTHLQCDLGKIVMKYMLVEDQLRIHDYDEQNDECECIDSILNCLSHVELFDECECIDSILNCLSHVAMFDE